MGLEFTAVTLPKGVSIGQHTTGGGGGGCGAGRKGGLKNKCVARNPLLVLRGAIKSIYGCQ